jgi:S1-C subfamily serine protease
MGINTAIFSRSGGSMGIGFAIPISTAQQVMQDLLEKGKVVRGWIGVEPQNLSAELAETFQLKPIGNDIKASGVVITGVLQNGPAARAGIRPGDVITQVAKQPVGNVSDLLNEVAKLKPGQPADVMVWRQQAELSLRLTPDERPLPKNRQR